MSASTGYQFYKYTPNQGAAISFAVLFGIVTAAAGGIIMTVARKSKWKGIELRNTTLSSNHLPLKYYNNSKLTGAYAPYWVGCILEIGGYTARSFSAKNSQALIPYIIQSILLLVAPAFYAATVYMLFGRIANLLYADKLLMFPAKYNTLIFVLGDVFSLLLQAAGGGLMARSSSAKSGTHIVIAGLFVQIFLFGLFISNEIFFFARIRQIPTNIKSKVNSFMLLNNTLLIGSILILLRSIVRAIEFIQGIEGTIISHEWYLYVFDALPMFLTTLVFILGVPWSSIFKIQEQSIIAQILNDESYSYGDGTSINSMVVQEEHMTDIVDIGKSTYKV